MDERENSYPAMQRKIAQSLAEYIYVSSPSTALSQVEERVQKWYYWQPGTLFPYREQHTPSAYYGGLTTNQALFVLVPGELVDARRRSSLQYLARCMGMRDQAQLEAYCEEAVREVLADPSPRPHPAFEADALARQVAYWVALLAYREVPQTDDWRW